MPEKDVIERARQDAREGKSPSTQAGEFVHEEIEHVREGKHGAKSAKQAIAIGLSKARRAGVKLPPPGAKSSTRVRRKAAQDAQSRKAPHAAPHLAYAVARDDARAQAPGACGRIEASPLEAGDGSRTQARRRSAVVGGTQGRAHEGRARALDGGEEGGAHARNARDVTRCADESRHEIVTGKEMSSWPHRSRSPSK